MTVYMRSSECRCGISFTPPGTLTLIMYGPGSDGLPAMTARRTDDGSAAKGFQSMFSGRIAFSWSKTAPLAEESPCMFGEEMTELNVIALAHEILARRTELRLVMPVLLG